MRTTLRQASLLVLTLPSLAWAEDVFTVRAIEAADMKPVQASLESPTRIPARLRTGGTNVKQGQIIAVAADQRLVQQAAALDAAIEAAAAQSQQASAEYDRHKPLFEAGAISQSQMDGFRTAATAAAGAMKARQAERRAVGEQIAQGKVLAPASGRIMTLPAALGTVMMPGEVVATMARQDLTVRIKVPESFAGMLELGQSIRLDGHGLPDHGNISQLYPQVENGQIQADIAVTAATGFYVGQRVTAWVPAGLRSRMVVPAASLTRRFGVDYVRLRQAGGDLDVPVQVGSRSTLSDGKEAVEILSGVVPGDTLVLP